MSTLMWVLGGIIVYTLIAIILDRRGVLPDSVGVQGPILTLHTKRGRAFLDWLAGPKRFWRAWSNFGIGIALVVMFGTFLFLVIVSIGTIQNPPPETAVNQPQNFLAIPGVNQFLPLEVAPEIVTGLVVGLVVHEGGHGLLCRVEDIDIESMGLAFFSFVPVGAFVEPNEPSQKRASRGGRVRMFAAGVTNNFAISIVVFLLLFGPVIASIGVAPGASVGQVIPGSAADASGIDRGDRITAINGTTVRNNSHLDTILAQRGDRRLTVEVNDGRSTTTVERSVQVIGTVQNGPTGLSRGETIRAVNGTRVYTEEEYLTEIRKRELVRVTTNRTTHTFPAGTYAVVDPEGPLARAGAPTGGAILITAVDGTRTATADDLMEVVRGIDPDRSDPVRVTAFVNGSRETFNVSVVAADHREGSIIGVGVVPGVSGATVSDFGIRTYPAGAYLTVLGGTPADSAIRPGPILESFWGKIGVSLFLPLIGITGQQVFQYNFAGFTGFNTNFYQPVGPLSFLGPWVFLLANVLYWIGWINVQIGLFNCIPAFPLDGGHILRSSAEAVVSRLPVGAKIQTVRIITTTVGVTMLVSLLLMILGPQLLG